MQFEKKAVAGYLLSLEETFPFLVMVRECISIRFGSIKNCDSQ